MNSANGLPLHQFNKLDHCRAFLKNSVRLDGRNFEDNRIVRISMDTIKNEGVIGSSHVQLGETVVFCGINVLIGNPSITAPDSGDCGKYIIYSILITRELICDAANLYPSLRCVGWAHSLKEK